MVNNKKIFRHCDTCNVDTETPAKWIKHVGTQRHIRKGTKKNTIYKCDHCDYQHRNKTNFNIHNITQHGTEEEKKAKCKYYCSPCNMGMFSRSYFDKHIKSKKHQNMELINKLDNE
jgi:hypothetical protein